MALSTADHLAATGPDTSLRSWLKPKPANMSLTAFPVMGIGREAGYTSSWFRQNLKVTITLQDIGLSPLGFSVIMFRHSKSVGKRLQSSLCCLHLEVTEQTTAKAPVRCHQLSGVHFFLLESHVKIKTT